MVVFGNIYLDKVKFLPLFFIIIVIVLFLIILSSNKKHLVQKIQYEYVGIIDIDSYRLTDKSFKLFYELMPMKRVLIKDFNYNGSNDTLLETLDFDKYDYVVTYQKKVIDIEYDEDYAKKNDHCKYIKNLKPIKIQYSNVMYENQLFIYKIYKKGQYRHLCP